MSDSLSWVGRLFHIQGPAAANERSPRRVLVRCTRYVLMSVVGIQWQTQVGNHPPDTQERGHAALYTSTAILNYTRWQTGRQCSCCRTGVMLHVLMLVTSSGGSKGGAREATAPPHSNVWPPTGPPPNEALAQFGIMRGLVIAKVSIVCLFFHSLSVTV